LALLTFKKKYVVTMAKQRQVAIGVYLCSLVIKILLIPAYRSTDFEVHRNWLAITHTKHYKEWYSDGASKSEWTLDYPPLFAWFEWGLSQVGALVDKEMVDVDALGYASEATIMFQRFTVMVTEILLLLGTWFAMSGSTQDGKESSEAMARKCLAVFLVLAHPGLYIVDHIHFQYNGMLLGILLISMSFGMYGNDILATVAFTTLLCMKHIFLYVAPAFGAYYLGILWTTKSSSLLFKLVMAASSVLVVTFGPFARYGMIPQIISRLFPVQRGLVHAYWAPNFWAIYAALDKILSVTLPRLGLVELVDHTKGNMTGGLVGIASFSVLPEIQSSTAALVTFCSMTPALISIMKRPYPGMIPMAIIYCSLCSFMFGYHVHEKAILMALIPMGILAAQGRDQRAAGRFLFLTIIGTYSLFPLLTRPQEYLLKISILVAYVLCAIPWLKDVFFYETLDQPRRQVSGSTLLTTWEAGYLWGIIPLEIYSSFIHSYIFGTAWPFIPLMLISVYSSLGVMYSWLDILLSEYQIFKFRTDKMKTT